MYFCPRGEGILRISGDGDEREIWIDLKFLILGIFGVGKLGIFLCRGGEGGRLTYLGIFWGIQKKCSFVVVPAYPVRVELRIKYNVLCHLMLSENF